MDTNIVYSLYPVPATKEQIPPVEQKRLAQLLNLNKEVHYSRITQAWAARKALINCLEKVGHNNIEWSQLEITNDQHLGYFSDMPVGLSHTSTLAAAIIALDPNIISVGIDVENSKREMKVSSSRHFIRKEDHYANDNILYIWTIKEACFKAYDPIYRQSKEFSKDLVLKDLWINSNGQFGHFSRLDQPIGQYSVKEISYEKDTYLLAKAFLTND